MGRVPPRRHTNAKLATVLTSGRPTVTPVWILYESDGVIRIETGAASAKVKALRWDPRASLVVDLEEPPHGYVRVDATATFVTDPAEVYRVAVAVGRRYMGDERAEEYGKRNRDPGQIVIEFHSTRVTAWADITH